MHIPRRILGLTAVMMTAGVALYYAAQRTGMTDEFKNMVEQKISSVFDTTISVSKIGIGPLKYVSLSGVRVSQGASSGFLNLLDVKKIVFNYDVRSLFSTDFSRPNRVCVYTPTIAFSQIKIPHALVTSSVLRGGRFIMLEVRDGNVRYQVPGLATRLLIRGIDGYISPRAGGLLGLEFHGKGGDDLVGTVFVTGTYDTKTHSAHFDLALHNMGITSAAGMPIKDVNGTVSVSNDTIVLKNLDGYIRDVPFELSGTITGYNETPLFDLTLTIETGYVRANFSIKGPASRLVLNGTSTVETTAHTIHGLIAFMEGGFRLTETRVDDLYDVRGSFYLNKGMYTLLITQGKQELSCKVVQAQYAVSADFVANHIQLFGYDFVGVGELKLEPDLLFWRSNQLVLHTTVTTDYLIFNYQPLKDFKASFTFTPREVRNLRCSWGNVYTATGSMTLADPKTVDVELVVNNLDLRARDTVCGYVIPPDVEGVVQGRINFTGPADNPVIQGYLSTGEGRVKQFEFKKATASFHGSRDLIMLDDAKIVRGNNIFYLRGNIDFMQGNIVRDLVLESSEKIVLWQGWDVTKDIGADVFFLRRPLSNAVDLKVQGALRSIATDEKAERDGSVSVDYNYRKDSDVSLAVEGEGSEGAVSVKHTMTF